MLYEFLKNNYKEAEPIFFSDIVIKGITKSAVNQQLKKLCNEGKLQKYENGIYYLPKKSRLKTSVGVNADTVARYKYVSRGGKVDGFYSGNTFANQLGISTQVPNKVEIVSNNMAAKVREVPIGKRTFIVRKPVVPVNEENVYVLQLLDLLKNLDVYLDESLRQFDTVYPAAGNNHSAVRLAVPELEKIAGAKGWIDVCKEPEKSE